MNSLNILTARVSPPPTPSPSRSTTTFASSLTLASQEARRSSRDDLLLHDKLDEDEEAPPDLPAVWQAEEPINETVRLLKSEDGEDDTTKSFRWSFIPKHVATTFLFSLHWLLSTLAVPGYFVKGLFYDDEGRFTPLRFLPGKASAHEQSQRIKEAQQKASGLASGRGLELGRRSSTKSKARMSNSSSSGLSSESESEKEKSVAENEGLSRSSSRSMRSKSLQSGDEIAPARRSIRIKLHNEDSLRQRKHRKSSSTSSQSNGSGGVSPSELTAATLKSPTSPAASLSLTKYPRAPAPPRPLIPARMPSYTFDPTSEKRAQKTLILDLDETLIHSMAKGGRMSTGHMVEVKLNTYIGAGGQPSAGPQHPILYYVHKRPYCDDFLRRVCKWYNLVIFTASVQEYADPVIDWLEQERKFFSGRFYRQHCTYRHGAFIKDLSSVEPDLSKVMILDNSPLSYMFHQDNAIPIEGWINDPTDNDLLHLVPLLEGLQYVTDVRALLALRGGEDGKNN